MKTNTLPKTENESIQVIGKAKLSTELIQELGYIQEGNNAGINERIKRLDEVLDLIVCIHQFGKEAMIKRRMLDSIASLRWVIDGYKLLMAPVDNVSE